MHLNRTEWACSLAFALILPAPAFAVDAACKPILDANQAKFAAPAFHDTMYASPGSTTATGEFIKIGQQAWMKADKNWMTVPPSTLKNMQNSDADGFGMRNCTQQSSSPNRIYTWDISVAGKTYSGAKLTLSPSGLPIRNETGDGEVILTHYENVIAPKVGK